MADLLTLDEIMAMAIQMEAGAAAFYRRTAGNARDEKLQAMLTGFAATEDSHKQTFAAMRRKAAETVAKKAGASQLAGEGGLFMEALASGIRAEGSGADSSEMAGNPSADRVLAFAVEMEKEAVLFYVGMRDIVPMPDREWLERIIAEEKQHLTTLARELGRARNEARSGRAS